MSTLMGKPCSPGTPQELCLVSCHDVISFPFGITPLIYKPPADKRDLMTKSENLQMMHIFKFLSM